MKRSRHGPDQVVRKPREGDRLLRGHGPPRCPSAVRGRDPNLWSLADPVIGRPFRRRATLKNLEREIARLKRLPAKKGLANDTLREVARGNGASRRRVVIVLELKIASGYH